MSDRKATGYQEAAKLVAENTIPEDVRIGEFPSLIPYPVISCHRFLLGLGDRLPQRYSHQTRPGDEVGYYECRSW